ncbi:MAG: GntR family transcriptional regulator [Negativicutes bacterium]|nr:GntR family transcriptional regulator [Negativicutes bacterium]
MNNLKPIQFLPARERVASALRKAILSKELKEGEEISLEGIASQLGVSITPVREAFQILNSEGLVKLRPNRGAKVCGINKKNIQDHFEMRAILESEAAAKVCQSGVDLSDILEAYNKAVEASKDNNAKEYTNYNQAFHVAIWNSAGNEKIKSVLSNMWSGLSMAVQVSEEEYAKLSMVEHEELMAALVNRDTRKARKLMRDHILRSMNDILTRFE